MVACDFCGQRPALLYCRADSAKLCLSCDQHVHSANALSKKHLRSQICDNCAAEPSSVRCVTDGLLLCQDCDWDAHGSSSVSSAHDCFPMDGFTGCPSAFDLALAWGLEIEDKKTPSYEWGGLLEELMVPNASWVIRSNCGSQLVTKKSPSCGKKDHVIIKQLLELLADGGGGEGTEDVSPPTPTGGGWLPEIFCKEQLQEENKQQQQQPPEDIGFTTLLMMPISENPEDEANRSWNLSTCHGAQIWDFNLGKLRGHDEPGALELEYNGSDMMYPDKTYGELLQYSSLAKRRGLDLSGSNSNNNLGHATLEANNLPVPESSLYSGFLNRSESMSAVAKAEMELLAQSRGNAMQRYKEKKKTRRFEKQIRYESRKARAETRKRVKGRFVKASKAPPG